MQLCSANINKRQVFRSSLQNTATNHTRDYSKCCYYDPYQLQVTSNKQWNRERKFTMRNFYDRQVYWADVDLNVWVGCFMLSCRANTSWSPWSGYLMVQPQNQVRILPPGTLLQKPNPGTKIFRKNGSDWVPKENRQIMKVAWVEKGLHVSSCDLERQKKGSWRKRGMELKDLAHNMKLMDNQPH